MNCVKKMNDNKFNGAQIADVISMAHFEAMDRPSLFDKMKKGTFVKENMKNFSVKNEDCEKAFKKLLSQKADKS